MHSRGRLTFLRYETNNETSISCDQITDQITNRTREKMKFAHRSSVTAYQTLLSDDRGNKERKGTCSPGKDAFKLDSFSINPAKRTSLNSQLAINRTGTATEPNRREMLGPRCQVPAVPTHKINDRCFGPSACPIPQRTQFRRRAQHLLRRADTITIHDAIFETEAGPPVHPHRPLHLHLHTAYAPISWLSQLPLLLLPPPSLSAPPPPTPPPSAAIRLPPSASGAGERVFRLRDAPLPW